MEKMEHMLDMWIEDLDRTRTPVSQAITQREAKSVYDDLKRGEREFSFHCHG